MLIGLPIMHVMQAGWLLWQDRARAEIHAKQVQQARQNLWVSPEEMRRREDVAEKRAALTLPPASWQTAGWKSPGAARGAASVAAGKGSSESMTEGSACPLCLSSYL